MTLEDETFIEFESWFNQQSHNRIEVAFNRAERQFNEMFYRLSDNQDYIEDNDFINILSLVLTDLWTQDTMRELQQEGSVILDVQADGNLRAYVS